MEGWSCKGNGEWREADTAAFQPQEEVGVSCFRFGAYVQVCPPDCASPCVQSDLLTQARQFIFPELMAIAL